MQQHLFGNFFNPIGENVAGNAFFDVFQFTASSGPPDKNLLSAPNIILVAAARDWPNSMRKYEKNMGTKKQLLNFLFSGLGLALGYYCGLMIFFPIAGALIAMALAKRFAPKSFTPFLTALGIIAGHGFWMLSSVILLAIMQQGSLLANFMPVSIDLVIIAVGIAWLLWRPGLGPVIFLGLYEIILLVMNALVLFTSPLGMAHPQALVLHIVLRMLALVMLIVGYCQSRPVPVEEAQAEALPPGSYASPVHILAADGQQTVHEESDVLALLARNELTPDTHFWKPGMAEWQPLSQLVPASPVPPHRTDLGGSHGG